MFMQVLLLSLTWMKTDQASVSFTLASVMHQASVMLHRPCPVHFVTCPARKVEKTRAAANPLTNVDLPLKHAKSNK